MAGRRKSYKARKKQLPRVVNQLSADWQDRQTYALSILIYAAPVFNRDVEAFRSSRTDPGQAAIYLVSKYGKFGLRPYALPLITHYIESNEVNPLYMLPAAIAVSTKENIAGPAIAFNNARKLKEQLDKQLEDSPDSRVYLIIHPDATKEDLLEWVNNNYDLFLKERLEKLDPTRPKRIRTSDPEKLKRDMDLYEHIIVNGESVKPIAEKYDLEIEHARVLAAAIRDKIVEPQI